MNRFFLLRQSIFYYTYRIMYVKRPIMRRDNYVHKYTYLERCSSDKEAELSVEESDRLGERGVLVLDTVSLID